jgi:hypothetical protein
VPSLSNHSFTSLCAAAIVVCAIGAAGPAHAASTAAPTGLQVEVASTAPVYDLPRLHTAVASELQPGDTVQTFCAFSNDGIEWVKMQFGGYFGFVQSTHFNEVPAALPRTCPNEIETVEITAFTKTFKAGELLVPLPAFTCPASYPYLLDSIDNASFFEPLPRGVTVDRPAGIVVDPGQWSWYEDGGRFYANGYDGGTISNHPWAQQSAAIRVACTNNVALAHVEQLNWPPILL